MIYKILPEAEWQAAMKAGTFRGSAVDLRDGYIHFSSKAQVRETAARHFSGQPGLLLLAVDEADLGDSLKWEVSRGGALFPHLYAELPVKAVAEVMPLPWDGASHLFPQGFA